MQLQRIMTALGFLVLIGADTARADIVTYYISGTVSVFTDTSTNHFVPTTIQDNTSTFVGFFSYDRSAPQVLNNPGIYRGTALNLAATITIDGKYTYTLGAPTDIDEIDLLGSSFELFARGPTVTTSFSPNPPFSHFEFIGTTSSDNLLNAKISNTSSSAGVSDQQTSSDPYYFIGADIGAVVAVPEPSSLLLVGLGAGSLLLGIMKRRRSALAGSQ